MSSLRPESHVAQQIRRDKLRILNSSHHSQDLPTNIEQLSSLHPGLHSDFLQVRNNVTSSHMPYEPPYYSSEIPSFSNNNNTLSPEAEVKPSRLVLPHYTPFPHSSELPARSDLMIHYGSSSSSGVNETNDVNSSYNYYNELIRRQLGEINHPSPSSLQDIVKFASMSAQGSDHHHHHHNMVSQMQHPGHGNWIANHTNHQLHFGNTNTNININSNSNTNNNNNSSDPINNPHQGLSLSLSSNSQSKASLSGKSVMMRPSSLDYGKSSLQEMVGVGGVTSRTSTVGPLGPFTGYATILKSSRFLKPAQELLDEFCNVCGSNVIIKGGSDFSRVSGDHQGSTTSATELADINNSNDSGISAKMGVSNNAGSSASASASASHSILYSSKENSAECESSRGGFDFPSSRSMYHQKKAKLLYMQEEVTRKFRQYHQQMQMVVSSFESVAGLSSATPYISMALKSVARHFRILKNAILDQIKHLREILGEEFAGSTSGTFSKLDTGLTYLDPSFQRNKNAFLEPQQVWRPQRGLPERAVAILKAWLFEHFLHPYPTDTDKHMLATQTGLSRNQVSNWFINARVRVWKPMVEEIHNLETKAMEGTCVAEGSSQQAAMVEEPPLGKFGRQGEVVIPEKHQFQCLGMSSSGGGVNSEGVGFMMGSEQWNNNEEKTPNMDGTLMGFVPYRRGGGGLDVGGIGSVSLTLGLRHGVEAVHQQLQQEDQIRRQFGEHMIHDFVG